MWSPTLRGDTVTQSLSGFAMLPLEMIENLSLLFVREAPPWRAGTEDPNVNCGCKVTAKRLSLNQGLGLDIPSGTKPHLYP